MTTMAAHGMIVVFLVIFTRSTGILADNSAGDPMCTGVKLDLVFLLDSSMSIRELGDPDPAAESFASSVSWTNMLQLVSGVVNSLPIGPEDTKVGFINFARCPVNYFTLDRFTDKSRLMTEINYAVYYGDFTADDVEAEAIRKLRGEQLTVTAGDRPEVPDLAVIISDGGLIPGDTDPGIQEARQAGVKMAFICLNIMTRENDYMCRQWGEVLSSPPTEEFMFIARDTSEESLTAAREWLTRLICSHYSGNV